MYIYNIYIKTNIKEKLLKEEEKTDGNFIETNYLNKLTVITTKIQNWNKINNELESKVLYISSYFSYIHNNTKS